MVMAVQAGLEQRVYVQPVLGEAKARALDGLAISGETLKFDDISSPSVGETTTVEGNIESYSKYLFTNLEFKITLIPNGRRVYTLIAREFDENILNNKSVKEINDLIRQGRLISVKNNSLEIGFSPSLSAIAGRLGCERVSIVRTFSVVEDGHTYLKHKMYTMKI